MDKKIIVAGAARAAAIAIAGYQFGTARVRAMNKRKTMIAGAAVAAALAFTVTGYRFGAGTWPDPFLTRDKLAATPPASVAVPAASACANDYTFQPVSVDVRNGDASELAVRIVHKTTGKPVEGAVLFRTRLDMSPAGMEMMTAKHAALPSTEPGVYKFHADLTMAGGWALKLMAKVPCETETVQGTVVFTAK